MDEHKGLEQRKELGLDSHRSMQACRLEGKKVHIFEFDNQNQQAQHNDNWNQPQAS
jgi:hypothetical protein